MSLLGGSWVLVSRVTSSVSTVIAMFKVLTTVLISAHEPSSTRDIDQSMKKVSKNIKNTHPKL